MPRIRPAPSAAKLSFLVKSKSNTKEISRSLKVMFVFVLTVFALNFGFVKFNSSRTNVLVRFVCGFQALLISFIFLLYCTFMWTDVNLKMWLSMYIVKYCFIVFGLVFKTKLTFFDFYMDLLSIDKELGIKSSPNLGLIMTAGISFSFVYLSIQSILSCTLPTNGTCFGVDTELLFGITIISSDIFLIIYFNIYYFLYYRLKVFTNFISNGSSDVVTSQYLYKSIADTADGIKSAYNNVYVAVLVLHTLDIMMVIFVPLIIANSHSEELFMSITSLLSVLHVVVMLFSPAFASGLLSAQVDKLNVILHERVLLERDQKHVLDLERFSRYIEVRPLKTIIWKIIPLDWKLPVIILNLSVTYLIVMFQFSRKF